jgi:hypothetical protein
MSNATAYTIDIAYDSAFTQMITSFALNAPTLSATVGPNGAPQINWQPGTSYYWRVRATAPLGSPWSGTRSFDIQPGAALVPEIGSPISGSTIDSTTPAFSWTPVAGATQYSFQLSTVPDFGSLVYSTATATTAVRITTALDEGTTYFWRVRCTAPVLADWSAVGTFTVAVPAPPAPTPTTTTTTTILTVPAPTQATIATVTVTPPAPAVTITQAPAPTITIPAAPPAATYTLSIPAEPAVEEIAPTYIWAIIIIGAVLVIAVIVLIVRTRRTV